MTLVLRPISREQRLKALIKPSKAPRQAPPQA
jgi:hypothetical protein